LLIASAALVAGQPSPAPAAATQARRGQISCSTRMPLWAIRRRRLGRGYHPRLADHRRPAHRRALSRYDVAGWLGGTKTRVTITLATTLTDANGPNAAR
jgi:hypothetical protein